MWRLLAVGRRMLRHPARPLTILALLTLGVGLNFAVAVVLEAVYLRATPFPESERVVMLWGDVERGVRERRGASLPDYFDWKREAKSFSAVSAWWEGFATIRQNGANERIGVEYVDADYFRALGLEPALGRGFTQEEATNPGAQRAAILGAAAHRDRFASKESAIGSLLEIGGVAYTVVGVAPAGFAGLSDSAQVFLPLSGDSSFAERREERGSRWFAAVARLAPGIGHDAAQAELDTLSARLAAAYPRSNEKRSVEVAAIDEEFTGRFRRPFALVFWASIAILLLAVANVLNLILVRSESRGQEMAIRRSLGATNIQLSKELAFESIVFAGAAAVAGAGLGSMLLQVLQAASPVPLPSFLSLSAGPWSVGYLSALSAVLAAALTMVPFLRIRKEGFQSVARQQASVASSSRSTLRSLVIATEIALSVLLVAATFLFAWSFQAMLAVDSGYDTARTLSMGMSLPDLAPTTGEERAEPARILLAEVGERLRAVPGVTAVAFATDAPLKGPNRAIFYTAQGDSGTDAATRPRAYVHRVSPGYFEALGVQMLAGSPLRETSPENAVVVTKSLVARFWPGESGVGKRLKAGGPDSQAPWMEIVGVAPDLRYRGLPENPTADADLFLRMPGAVSNAMVIVKGELAPETLIGPVRAAIRALRPEAVVFAADTTADQVREELTLPRFLSWTLGGVALLSLVLAASGIYAVTAAGVALRRHEIGVRMAVGASPAHVVRRELRYAGGWMAAGGVLGVAGFLAAARLLESMVRGLSDGTIAGLGLALITLLSLGLCAALFPALRAGRANPVETLRTE